MLHSDDELPELTALLSLDEFGAEEEGEEFCCELPSDEAAELPSEEFGELPPELASELLPSELPLEEFGLPLELDDPSSEELVD